MTPFDERKFIPDEAKDGATLAREKFNVDLNDDRAVRAKLIELQTKTDAVSELSNLWREHQENKKMAA